MRAACLVAEFENNSNVKMAIKVLRKSNFHSDAISLVWKGHEKGLEKIDRHVERRDPLEFEKMVQAGSAIAAMAGVPLGISSIIGPIMVAVPLAAIAGGAAVGGVMAKLRDRDPDRNYSESDVPRGLFARANHYGIHAHDPAHYEDRIQDGAVLIIVISTSPRLDEAQAVLKTTGPANLGRFALQTKAKS